MNILVKMNKRFFIRSISMIISAGLLLGCSTVSAFAAVKDEDPIKYKMKHIGELTQNQKTYKETASIFSVLNASNNTNNIKSVKKIRGIDVSAWQGNKINWKKVKKSGIQFAIIRTSYARLKTGKLETDMYYKRNIVNASKAGIKIGAYIYSEAVTKAQAEREAKYIVKTLKPYKNLINMPVVMDVESAGKGTYWRRAWNAKKLTRTKVVDNYKAFAKIVKKAGYTPMFYTYSSFLFSYVDMKALNKTGDPFWLADYTGWDSPKYFLKHGGRNYPYEFWQYSSSARINGINGKTDVNYWYTDSINRYTPKTTQKKTAASADGTIVTKVVNSPKNKK